MYVKELIQFYLSRIFTPYCLPRSFLTRSSLAGFYGEKIIITAEKFPPKMNSI